MTTANHLSEKDGFARVLIENDVLYFNTLATIN